MKKLLSATLLLLFLLTACNTASDIDAKDSSGTLTSETTETSSGDTKENSSETSTENSPETSTENSSQTLSGNSHETTEAEVPLTEDEINRIRAVTDPAVMEISPIDDLSHFYISIFRSSIDGSFHVRYSLMLGGMNTYTGYSVRISQDYTFEYIDGNDIYKYLPFLENATQEAIDEAKNSLPEGGGYSFSVTGNSLYLCMERIVSIENASGMSGCNIDHRHEFYQAWVCDKDEASTS